MVGSALNEEKGTRKAIDATVGGLVWVQRRNGSWWPGQIVGLDELSENGSGSGSPKPGTPIKLLGRDDPCLDWYDLETTKVVKAFRCGEYDTCIEKAKVSAPNFLKRSLRYPRREIAIFRALEIENSSPIKNCPNLSDNQDDEAQVNFDNGFASVSHPTKNIECSSEETSSELTTACEDNSNSTQELSHSGITYEETNGSTCLKGWHDKGKRKTPNDSEDDENEGLKRMKGLNDLGVGSNQKVQVLALVNPVNGTRAANVKAVGTLTNGGASLSLRKRRSQVVHTHELLKRKCRRRPLTKVLESTTMVPVRIICDEFANPFERSDAISCECEDGGKVKDTKLLSMYLPEVYSSGTQFDVPFIDEELDSSGFSPVCQPSSSLKPRVGASKGSSSHNSHVSASSVECEAVNEHAYVNRKVEKGSSKWQSKGKRKARYLSKNDDLTNSPSSHNLINGFTDLRKRFSVLASSQRSFSYNQPQLYSSEFPNVPSLYEVELSVEASRPQVQYVPYVSLVSKLSGKPITGHPIVVEALEHGFCDLQTSDYPANGSCELDDEDARINFVAKPKQRKTKRRVTYQPHFSRRKGKSLKSKKRHGSSSQKRHGSASQKRHGSSSQKRHSSSSKKTRKLSSLTGPHKLIPEKGKAMVQSSKGPTLACVPLKIVFSRISEALSGSRRSAHRSASLNNT